MHEVDEIWSGLNVLESGLFPRFSLPRGPLPRFVWVELMMREAAWVLSLFDVKDADLRNAMLSNARRAIENEADNRKLS